uniref:NHL repeat-containing protein n=1 Tax=uncultured bacterium Contigcl_1764b TaxID=1393658 RepID=W0FSK7_9BACT|nr:NHL repeat-containing protein [uncultured bacterium Contigcl_1764b]
MKKAISLLLILMLLLPAAVLADDSYSMKDDGFSTSYTYNYDYWSDVQASPDAYRVSAVIDSITIGLENLGGIRLNKPQSMYARDRSLYVVDSGNNRIVELRFDGRNYRFVRVISEIAGCENGPSTFNAPSDVFVDTEGNIYVADYNNMRVVMMDKDLNWLKEFTKPSDSTFDQSLDFLPSKIAVDVAGRLYVLVTNVNKGFAKYESDTTFTGFIGANAVSVNMAEYIWKRYFQTKEQRAASESFVPTEYENLYMDDEGFIYATNTVFSEYDLKFDNAKPIRRLNSLGGDILIKNDRYPPIGDQFWIEQSVQNGPTKFTDITVLENDIYVAVDRTRGRLFGYDSQGVMLWAFGTKGNVAGAFTRAVSLDHIGRDLLVLDQVENSITVFTPTEYGTKIYEAIDTYVKGEYDQSADLWREVMKLNANYPLAFRGIARAILRDDDFEGAMYYYKLAHDRESYGRVFKLYRKQWIEKNIWWVFLILAVLVIVPLFLGRIKRTKWEVIMHEQSKVRR